MKKLLSPAVVSLIVFLFLNISCRQSTTISSSFERPEIPVAVEGKEDLFHAGRFYFGGQPDEEMLRSLAREGVKVIINVRSLKEMDTHTNERFDEYELADTLGMTYFHFPMGGDEGYSPGVVDTLAHVLDIHRDKTFIHCKVSGRACYLWVAYLIRHMDVPIDVAIDIGREMKFRFVLEDLVGYSFSMRKKG